MGNYRCRREGFLSAWERVVCEMTFQGKKDKEIVHAIWPEIDLEDKKAYENAQKRLRTLRKKPHFIEYYKSICTEFQVHAYGKALSKIVEQIDSNQPWLANKAANDVLTRAQKLVLGDDENAVTVRIEGLPELGSPEMTDNDG